MSKKIILILAIILVILIIITSFISNLLKNKKPETEIKNIMPTAVVNYNSSNKNNNQNQTKLNPTEQAKQLIANKLISQIKIFSKADLEILSKLNKTLPYKSDDFDVEYSPFLNQYFVSRKTPDADKKIALWATSSGLSELIKNQNLFIFTDQPAEKYMKYVEEVIIQNDKSKELSMSLSKIVTPTSTIISSTNITITPDVDPVYFAYTKLLKSFFLSGITKVSSPEAKITPLLLNTQISQAPSQSTTPLGNYSSAPTSLAEIFNEAGQKVGVPAKILEAIMRNECSTPFTLSSQEIAQYSAPGGAVPFCLTRECGDTGPMQFTIGIDGQGNPLCPQCGAVINGYVNSCPNAWASYASSVNTYGGYSHSPSPLNIRDSVYATAAKLKHDSGNTDASNWTKEQVLEAGYRYSGCYTCRYSWLGNRTYGEYLWDYYITR